VAKGTPKTFDIAALQATERRDSHPIQLQPILEAINACDVGSAIVWGIYTEKYLGLSDKARVDGARRRHRRPDYWASLRKQATDPPTWKLFIGRKILKEM
jgi:hypothetical protein